ncbi:MAG TPA: 50S ribosomal protein L4 [Acidimicrobiales bacterium]|jgi:large subunit ribosomal protein L4|nr:50S ribosomal protein L4 [Acidimicrobiales bacterium]
MTRTAVRKERPAPVARTVVRRDPAGQELGTVDLEPAVFGIEPNTDVLHQVVTAQLAAARAGTQSTKTRAEVRGGGAKPFRQKGTGRARQGSTRSPSWAGGGVALGPKPRSYRQRTPKKMIRLALYSALSDRAAEERVALVDAWGWDEPKTKAAVAALEALGLTGRVLVVLGDEDAVAERSFGNLPRVQTILEGELAAYDILRNDWVVFTDRTLPGAEVVEVVEIVDVVDPETGQEVIEVVDAVIDTATGDAVVVEEEIVVDGDDGVGEAGEEGEQS